MDVRLPQGEILGSSGDGALACPHTGHFLMGTWEPQVRWVRSRPHLPRP